VNDLGWSLFEAGRLQEGEKALTQAVFMDPDDELAREDLRLCKEKLFTLERRDATPGKRTHPTRQKGRALQES
jgi:hypothetical protein